MDAAAITSTTIVKAARIGCMNIAGENGQPCQCRR
jgi:hypothetical protein